MRQFFEYNLAASSAPKMASRIGTLKEAEHPYFLNAAVENGEKLLLLESPAAFALANILELWPADFEA